MWPEPDTHTFVVTIYRQGVSGRSSAQIVGTVEAVQSGRRIGFRTGIELLRLLREAGRAKAGNGWAERDSKGKPRSAP